MLPLRMRQLTFTTSSAKYFNSRDDAASFLDCGMRIFTLISFCLVLILQHQFPGFLRNILFSTRLWISDIWIWVRQHQLTGCLYDDYLNCSNGRFVLGKPLLLFLGACGHTVSRLLTSCRHGELLSNMIGIVGQKVAQLASRIRREIQNIERTKTSNSIHLMSKLNLVRMSASWVLVLSFWGSNLILSKKSNQERLCEFWTRVSSSDFVLWIIILITASLSSKMYSWDALWQECVPRRRTPPCWAWWPAWRWWWLVAFWLLRFRKVVENVAIPRILSVQDPVCCFDEPLIFLAYKVLSFFQHIEDSLEFWLLLCIHDPVFFRV